jgi:hypothetical protein
VGAVISLAGDLFGVATAGALIAALALGWLGLRVAGQGYGRHLALIWPVAISFVVGYALLPREFAGFVPDAMQPWKWLPYAGLWAAFISSVLPPISKAGKFVIVAAAPIPAYCFTPGWPVWGYEPRSVIWLSLAYLLLIGLSLQTLPKRILGSRYLGLFAAATLILTVVIGGLVSLRLAQLAAIAASALLGAFLATITSRRSSEEASGESVLAVYAVLVGGIAWIACVEPDPPQPGLLAIPLLPAAMWIAVVPAAYAGINRRRGKSRPKPPVF